MAADHSILLTNLNRFIVWVVHFEVLDLFDKAFFLVRSVELNEGGIGIVDQMLTRFYNTDCAV